MKATCRSEHARGASLMGPLRPVRPSLAGTRGPVCAPRGRGGAHIGQGPDCHRPPREEGVGAPCPGQHLPHHVALQSGSCKARRFCCSGCGTQSAASGADPRGCAERGAPCTHMSALHVPAEGPHSAPGHCFLLSEAARARGLLRMRRMGPRQDVPRRGGPLMAARDRRPDRARAAARPPAVPVHLPAPARGGGDLQHAHAAELLVQCAAAALRLRARLAAAGLRASTSRAVRARLSSWGCLF
jgi:hypothetical protein